jgi:beta-1,4-mannosyl-glycoprotein beta-1,4-N-acetylglucosaminyltransferase
MVIDAFLYNGEREILDFRIKILSPVVDKFIALEGNRSFQGQELYGSDDFIQVEKHCADLTRRSWEVPSDSWEKERFQRDGAILATAEYSDNDIIITGDVDEIPSREAVELFKSEASMRFTTAFSVYPFYYNCKTMWPDMNNCPIICTVDEMRKISPRGLRHMRNTWPKIQGGWHLSYFGGVEVIQRKISSFSEAEYNRPDILDPVHIQHCIDTGEDVLKRGGHKSSNPGKEFFPDYFIQNAPEKWFQ